MSNYFSFLICSHPADESSEPRKPVLINLYYSGIPIGIISDGLFAPHVFINPVNGSRKTITINDLPNPCPFKGFAELKAAVISAVSKIEA